MDSQQAFEIATVHRHFSADYFKRVWELLDRPGRTCEEEESMVSMCLTADE